MAVGNARGAIFFYRLVSKATRLRPELALHVAPPANDKALNVTLTCIRFSPCSTYLAVGTASGTVLVFNLKDRSRLDIKCHHDDHRGKAISALCWSYDSSKLFSGCIGGVVIEFIYENASDWNKKSSTSAMALNFASALLMGKKYTTLICQCEEIIRQIECTFSESCSCGSADILLVSVAHHSLLFQLPINRNNAPRFCDIPLHMKQNKDQDDERKEGDERFDDLWCAACFCNSYISTGENNQPQIRATGIIVAQSCGSGIQLVFCTLDGEVQHKFDLQGPYSKPHYEQRWQSCCLGVRCLGSFSGTPHKHLMTLITSDNCLLLINLQDMSCDFLQEHFDYSVHAAVPTSGRLLVLYEDVHQEMMVADVLECLTPTSARPPVKIFDSNLYLTVTYMKRCWQRRRAERREREERGLAAAISPSSGSSYHSNGDDNAFMYYEPCDTESDLVSSIVVSGANHMKSHNRTNKLYVRSESEKGLHREGSHREGLSYRDGSYRDGSFKEGSGYRDAPYRDAPYRDTSHRDAGAEWKKLDDLEIDLNHALTSCDEELEAWAFDAAAASSLTSLMGERGVCQVCRCATGISNNELGGGGGGARSLDEIAKYGAILSKQGVLSAEAITQLSSLQLVLSGVDADGTSPRQSIVGGYDYYGLYDEEQQKRISLSTAKRARVKERKRCLKNIIADSIPDSDSMDLTRHPPGVNIGSVPTRERRRIPDTIYVEQQGRGEGGKNIFSTVSSTNSSCYELRSLLSSNDDNREDNRDSREGYMDGGGGDSRGDSGGNSSGSREGMEARGPTGSSGDLREGDTGGAGSRNQVRDLHKQMSLIDRLDQLLRSTAIILDLPTASAISSNNSYDRSYQNYSNYNSFNSNNVNGSKNNVNNHDDTGIKNSYNISQHNSYIKMANEHGSIGTPALPTHTTPMTLMHPSIPPSPSISCISHIPATVTAPSASSTALIKGSQSSEGMPLWLLLEKADELLSSTILVLKGPSSMTRGQSTYDSVCTCLRSDKETSQVTSTESAGYAEGREGREGSVGRERREGRRCNHTATLDNNNERKENKENKENKEITENSENMMSSYSSSNGIGGVSNGRSASLPSYSPYSSSIFRGQSDESDTPQELYLSPARRQGIINDIAGTGDIDRTRNTGSTGIASTTVKVHSITGIAPNSQMNALAKAPSVNVSNLSTSPPTPSPSPSPPALSSPDDHSPDTHSSSPPPSPPSSHSLSHRSSRSPPSPTSPYSQSNGALTSQLPSSLTPPPFSSPPLLPRAPSPTSSSRHSSEGLGDTQNNENNENDDGNERDDNDSRSEGIEGVGNMGVDGRGFDPNGSAARDSGTVGDEADGKDKRDEEDREDSGYRGADDCISVCATEDDNTLNPFTDSDISWMEWWWDLDRERDDVYEHQSTPLRGGKGAKEAEGAEGAESLFYEHQSTSEECMDADTPGLSLKRRMRARRERFWNQVHGPVQGLESGYDRRGVASVLNHVPSTTSSPESSSALRGGLQRGRHRVIHSMESIPLLSVIRQEEAPRNMYDVTVIAPRGLGLNLSLLPGGSLMVRAFNALADDETGIIVNIGAISCSRSLFTIIVTIIVIRCVLSAYSESSKEATLRAPSVLLWS